MPPIASNSAFTSLSAKLTKERDELNKYKLPTITVCFGVLGAVFAFILMLNINTSHLEKEFSGDSRLQMNMFKDWLALNVNEVEKLSRFLSATPPSSADKLFHTLVNQTIERDVFTGVYLVSSSDVMVTDLNVLSAVTRGSNPDDLLLQSALKGEIIQSILSKKPAATDPMIFPGDSDKHSKVAIIFPIIRKGNATEAIVALLEPGMQFEAMRNEEKFADSNTYIFNEKPDGTEQLFHGNPQEFMRKAFLHYKFSNSEILQKTSAFSYVGDVRLFSEQWKIVFVATSGYISKANTAAPWIVMAACLALSGMTGAFLFHLIGQNVRTENTVRERTRELLDTSEQLKNAKEAAEAANRAKSDFLANISHEIRTPLSSMIGLTELMLETELSVQQQNHMRTILNSGEILLELINDILDFSKIESGKLDLDPIPFDLQLAIEDTVELFVPKTQEKDQQLELLVRFAPGMPRHVIGDVVRIRQIISNLINNAIKFTHEGYILVAVEKLEDDVGKENAMFQVSVQDTGIGIPKDKLNVIFEKFTQADTSTTRKFGGTGLGLSICRQLARMMQGEVFASSEYGKGSVFSFTMKLKLDSQAQQPEKLKPVRSLLEGKKALIVDDMLPSRTILAEYLSSVGIASLSTDRFQEALKMISDADQSGEGMDLLVTDYILPEMEGDAFTARVKALYPRMNIIMVTAMAEKGYAQIFASSGCDAYLTKPIKKALFIKTLETLFAAEQSGKNLSMLTSDVISYKKDVPKQVIGNEFLKDAEVLLVEDNKPNRDLGIKLLENFSCRPTAVCNGEEAIEIVKKRTFDLILMDCQMPEMDGFEASSIIRSMKEKGEITDIPVIALTANAMKGDRERCLESGMNDYLTKPLRKTALLNVLMEWLPPLEKRSSVASKDNSDSDASI